MATLMHKMPFPIQTEAALKFWASRHKCNRMKAIIAFSTDLVDANNNLRRFGYKRFWRLRALNNFGMYVNQPSMANIPLSAMEVPWWKCMPYVPAKPINLCLWIDTEIWIDTNHWTEVCPDPIP